MLNLDKNKKYLLACSYGPDSMALLTMLLKEGYDFGVAHVNYHFRKESDEEERKLKEFVKKNDIVLYVYDNEEKVTKNLEARARDIRYNFFKRIIDEEKYDVLLIGQHQDDLLETYIMQKRRNLHPFYFGIKEISYNFEMNIVRPLLNYTKQDLSDYCVKNNVPYAIDQSNYSLVHERNIIRHQIISKLSKEERNKLLEEIDTKNKFVQSILTKLSGLNLHSCETIKALSYYETIYAIQLIANECQIFKISNANLKEIIKIISSCKANVVLPYKSYAFIKEYDHIYFVSQNEEVNFSFTLDKPSKLDTPYFYLDFTKGAMDRNVCEDDYPLIIRNAKPKDKVKIKNYYKECRRLFIDWKVPLSLRKRWPVIINKNKEIIYIPRYQKDFVPHKDSNFYVK